MRRSSVVLALGGLYVAGTAAQNCSPQYSPIANWVADYAPAQSFCSSRYPGPTTTTTTTATIVVTQTARTQSKRGLPTDVFAHIGVHDKPRPDGTEHHVKRQGYSWTNYYYSQMAAQRGAAWVQGVCGCIVDPVTVIKTTARTITTVVAAPTPTVRTTSSSVKTSTSSIRSSSSSSTLRTSTLSIKSSSTPSASSVSSPGLSTRSSSASSTIIPSVMPPVQSSSSSIPSSGPAAPPSVSSSPSPSLPASSSTTTPIPSVPSSAPTSAVPPLDLVAASGCTNGDYSGTGACSCDYTILCNVAGNCGAAGGVVTTAVDSWQACNAQCDDNSACSAYTYSYATGICTQITDENCSTDQFQLVDDPGVSVLGVYVGSCQGTCLF